MVSNFRILPLGLLVVAASFAYGQQPTPAEVQQKLAAGSTTEDASQVKVFPLRNVAVSEIQTTLLDIFGADSELAISAQLRTNSLVVIGEPSTLNRIKDLLAVLDQQATEPAVKVLSIASPVTISPGMIEMLAQAAQVEVTVDRELGVVVVRSESLDRIERFRDVLRNAIETISESKADDRDVLIRVSWLSPISDSGRSTAITPDSSLKEAVAKLTSMGYNDLAITGQLMTRCSMNPTATGSVPEFKAEGRTLAGFTFGTRGHLFNRNGSGDGNIDVEMSVSVKNGVGPESPNDTLLSVVLKMKEGKPIILGSAPVAGAQSFFVVQFLPAD